MPTRRDRSNTGSAVVEFALVLPLLLVVALSLVQVGLLVRDRLLIEAAARAGARTAAVEADEGAVREAALAAAPDLDPALAGVVIARQGTQGDPVTVSVNYDEVVRVPLIGWLFGSSIHLDASATDRQEFA
ncbi:MAG: TadE/TadG family type IV pilus assembly protein [Actinomycetota bacterium]